MRLINPLQPDSRDLQPEPYRQCRFGEWYYQETPTLPPEHPAFAVIGREHQHIHHLGQHLLHLSAAGILMTPDDLDRYFKAFERFRLQLTMLKQEWQESLGDLDPLPSPCSDLTSDGQ